VGKTALSAADKLAGLAKVRTASDLLSTGIDHLNTATKVPGQKLASALLNAGANVEKYSKVGADTLQSAALFAERNPRLAAAIAAQLLVGRGKDVLNTVTKE
jgi:hypothetical protein